jgi:adenylate cyclase class 2
MEQLETEVKFYLSDIQSTRQRILDLGARSCGRFFESNVRFEDAEKTLKQKKSLLRLRRDQKVTLTFKQVPPIINTQFKVMKELEVEVSDFDTTHHILQALGFHHAQIYEKWRETLVLNQTHFCLDSLPFGQFLEIEGPEKDIQNYGVKLDFPWDQRILLNYLQIFEILQKKLMLNFSDVTFANFKNVKSDLAEYLTLLVENDG